MLRSIGEQLNWVSIWTMRTNVIHMIEQQAIQESYDFVSTRIGDAILFKNGVELQRHIIWTVRATGLICEFGVHNGASIRRFARALTKRTVIFALIPAILWPIRRVAPFDISCRRLSAV